MATFGGGNGCIVAAVVPEAARIAGKSVEEIAQDREFPSACVITGIFRDEDDEFIVPRGGVVVQAGDHVFLAATADDARKAVALIQRLR